MMDSELETSPTAMQLSVVNEQGEYLLSVLVKRTYVIGDDGSCPLAEAQLPLTIEPEYEGDEDNLLSADTDLFALKLRSDIVLKGHAYNPGSTSQFEAGIQLGHANKSIRVLGDRKCFRSRSGELRFSEPAPAEQVPLSYDCAYGGADRAYEEKYGNPTELLKPYLPNPGLLDVCPYNYPRNPAGKGFLLEATTKALERLELPNLEDPLDPLTPRRILLPDLAQWPLLPIPQAFNWVDHGWFPRVAHFGIVPYHTPLEKLVAEVERGFEDSDLMEERSFEEKVSLRGANGASLGLQVPFLVGNELCELRNIHPKFSQFQFQLPGERPRIWTDGREGKLNASDPVIHTVVIEPDESRLSIVWRGSALAIRPYLPEELETMPFRVEW